MKALSPTAVDISDALQKLRGNEPFQKLINYWGECEREATIAVASRDCPNRDWQAGRLSVFSEILAAIKAVK